MCHKVFPKSGPQLCRIRVAERRKKVSSESVLKGCREKCQAKLLFQRVLYTKVCDKFARQKNLTRVRDNSKQLPQKSGLDSVLQHCTTSVRQDCRKGVSYAPKKVSNASVAQMRPTGASYTRVSQKGAKHKRRTNMSCKKCPTRLSKKVTHKALSCFLPQVCATRVLQKACPTRVIHSVCTRVSAKSQKC